LKHPDGTIMLQIKGQRRAPNNPLRERVVTKKLSHWRAFAPCRGVKQGTEAYGAWMHDPHFAHKREWQVVEGGREGRWGHMLYTGHLPDRGR